MPYVFHTKSLQSILDPVAQQVAQLILIHEKAREGRIDDHLMVSIASVSAEVGNLVKICQQRADHSEDEKLKEEMSSAITAILEATSLSTEAAKNLCSSEKHSATDEKKLHDGSIDILNGFSHLLLVFDCSNVRKLVEQCEGLMANLQIAKLVNSVDYLESFSSRITENSKSVLKQVDARSLELTNASHVAILEDEVNQVNVGIPILLSALKMLMDLKISKSEGVAEAQKSRNIIVESLLESLKEIIRVLQLSSPTEEPGSLTSGWTGIGLGTSGAPPGSTMSVNIHHAKDLLQETDERLVADRAVISAVTECVSEARRMATAFSKDKRFKIEKVCDEIDSMSNDLVNSQAKGQGSITNSMGMADAIALKLDTLEEALKHESTSKIVRAFKELLRPLTSLSQAIGSSLSTPNRQMVFVEKVDAFKVHCKTMSETAAELAKVGGVMDKTVVEDLMRSTTKVKKLGPQVVHAANILFNNPNNKGAKAHYQTLEAEYSTQVSKLQKLVDSAVDPVQFLGISEAQIKDDLEEAKAYIKKKESIETFEWVASAARKAKRVMDVIEAKMESIDKPELKKDLQRAKERIATSIVHEVASGKEAILHPNTEAACIQFWQQAGKLVDEVHMAHSVLDKNYSLATAHTLVELPDVIDRDAYQQDTNPIGFAAHQLHQDAQQWEDKDNDMVIAAKRMANLMKQMAKFATGEEGEITSKREFIEAACMIGKESKEVVKIAKKVAAACTDKRMTSVLTQTLNAIPNIATQLKIIAAVTASRQGGDDPAADTQASEMLTDNTQNLMKAVSGVLYATEAASIRVPPASRADIPGLTWVKRAPKAKPLFA